MNYAYNNFVNVIDLYEIILLVREKFFGQVIVDIEAQGSNLVLKVFVGCPTISFTNVINVTLKDALEIENYKHVVVNMRRPMTIMSNDNSTFLVPEDYILKNGTYALISNDLVEPYTTIVSQKLLSDFDFTIYNGVDLILTNVKHVADESNLIFMVFKDFSYFDELRTLRLKFSDRVVELPQKINGVTIEFQDFEDFLQSEEYE
uniref:Uncharacterized protein n=1 Tax=Romanomermis culicivorax TaxID=13658 RepID=A0A915L079_ROMCU